ncbi:hypothetical protein L3X38_023355 [Prunus dulcis]|uniref:Uncharacterized protein n=1 Tax=Prunus dulcis TaxID=3755 RepID=A0AAD4VXT8_PRUDU|nr:hypothetical protein L3X38_023355 [Prunus dulcis]
MLPKTRAFEFESFSLLFSAVLYLLFKDFEKWVECQQKILRLPWLSQGRSQIKDQRSLLHLAWIQSRRRRSAVLARILRSCAMNALWSMVKRLAQNGSMLISGAFVQRASMFEIARDG